ncbi:hypothetical protein [Streptomyces sp. NPDC102437]|uniref:hypothetical protein n=1 Tax=Streptomyces sp. NPDC102437 TaxID=3366175 RepID=UPI0037FA256E
MGLLAVGELRGAGREVDAEALARISPARSSVVNYYGSITVDYEHELAQLDERGHGPCEPWQWPSPDPGCSGNQPAEPGPPCFPVSTADGRRARVAFWAQDAARFSYNCRSPTSNAK